MTLVQPTEYLAHITQEPRGTSNTLMILTYIRIIKMAHVGKTAAYRKVSYTSVRQPGYT